MMKRTTSRVVLGAALLSVVGWTTSAWAQTWQPTRPVRWLVPYVPGGANDLVARTVAEPLSARDDRRRVGRHPSGPVVLFAGRSDLPL